MERATRLFLESTKGQSAKIEDQIIFESTHEKDYRPKKVVYDPDPEWIEKHKGDESVLAAAEFETLRTDFLMKDIAANVGQQAASKLEPKKITLISNGKCIQPFHNDYETREELPDKNGNSIRSGSLFYPLTEEPVNLVVIIYGDDHRGQDGFVTKTLTVSHHEHIWLDDYVVHAGGQHDGPAVRMHVEVDRVGNGRGASKVHTLTLVQLCQLHKRQGEGPANIDKKIGPFLKMKQDENKASAWEKKQQDIVPLDLLQPSLSAETQGTLSVSTGSRKICGMAKVVSSLGLNTTMSLRAIAKKIQANNRQQCQKGLSVTVYHQLDSMCNNETSLAVDTSIREAVSSNLAEVFGFENASEYQVIGYGLLFHQGIENEAKEYSEPYHRYGPNMEAENTDRTGSLLYTVTKGDNASFEVIVFGDKGSGFVPVIMPILSSEALWIDDSVARAIHQSDLASVQLLVHVGLKKRLSQKAVSVVPQQELMDCFNQQQNELNAERKVPRKKAWHWK